MKLHYFIARRLQRSPDRQSLTPLIVKVATIAVALSICIMVISIAIVTGYKKEITGKVAGFASHIRITSFDNNNSLESSPISKNQPFYPSLNQLEGIKHIQVFATKAGIIKTDSMIQGIILKGMDSDFDRTFFSGKLIDGKIPNLADSSRPCNDVVISATLAKMLKLKTGDNLPVYFIQDPPRARKFRISGLYSTGMDDYDKLYVFCDIRHIQKLNNWDSLMVGGFEVFVDDVARLDELTEETYAYIGYDLNALSLKDLQPQIFSWLEVLDVNVQVIIILMIIVAVINMISALLILILERVNMIGILKALGMQNGSLQKIFLYNSLYIIGRGLFWGNLLALLFCFLQQQYGLIELDPEKYYLSQVPINFNWLYIIAVNAGTIIINIIILMLPSLIIRKISPLKALRYS